MEYLPDPINDRVIKQVKPPPNRPLGSHFIFPENNKGFFYFIFLICFQKNQIGRL